MGLLPEPGRGSPTCYTLRSQGHPSRRRLLTRPRAPERSVRKRGRSPRVVPRRDPGHGSPQGAPHPRPRGSPQPSAPQERASRGPARLFRGRRDLRRPQGRAQPGRSAPHTGPHSRAPLSPVLDFRGGSLNKHRKLGFEKKASFGLNYGPESIKRKKKKKKSPEMRSRRRLCRRRPGRAADPAAGRAPAAAAPRGPAGGPDPPAQRPRARSGTWPRPTRRRCPAPGPAGRGRRGRAGTGGRGGVRASPRAPRREPGGGQPG